MFETGESSSQHEICQETKAPVYHHLKWEGGKLTPGGEGSQQSA